MKRRNIFRAAIATLVGMFAGSANAQTKVSIGPIRGKTGPYLLGVNAAGNLVAITTSGTVALVPSMPGGALTLVGAAGNSTIPTLEQISSVKAGPGFAFVNPDKTLSVVAITAVDILNMTESANIEVTPIP